MYVEFKERNGSKVQAVSPTIRLIDSKQESPNRFHVIIGENNSIYAVEEKEYNRLSKCIRELGRR